MGERGPEYVGFLEDQVYRLNAELARYQHRGVAGASQLPPDTKNPPDSVPLFLVDSRNLTPLIRAYDDQVRFVVGMKTARDCRVLPAVPSTLHTRRATLKDC